MKTRKQKDWSTAPIVVLTGVIASGIAIFVFLTGRNSIPELFRPQPTSVINSINSQTSGPLDGSPIQWLPNPDELPSEVVFSDSYSVSNEDVAKNYANPAEVFTNLINWGRIAGFYQTFVNKNDCEATAGLREIHVGAVLYKDTSGAEAALEWFEAYDGETETLSTVGENGYFVWNTIDDRCNPQFATVKYVRIGFQRFNAHAYVDVGSIQSTMSDDDILIIATRVAELIDLKFVANAK